MDLSRRYFLAAPAALAAASPLPVRLGGPVSLSRMIPANSPREHRRLGYAAAYCPNIDIKDAPATEKAFQAENVLIAEVGA